MTKLYIIGASGHARVSLDILEAQGLEVAGFFDDDPDLIGEKMYGIPVLGDLSDFQGNFKNEELDFFIAIGNNVHRKKIAKQLEKHNKRNSINAVHYSAILSPRIKKGYGNFIAPGAIINTGTLLGNYVIINTGATVDHDNTLGDFVQLSPGCNLAGNVIIEEGAFIGTGAVILPGKKIGTYATIGAGAVVIHDIPPLSVAVGVPARIIKRNHVPEF